METRNWRFEPDGVYCVDAMKGLASLPAESVDCVMTSPPYWALRDYDNPPVRWSDGTKCPLGMEKDITRYVDHLCGIFDEVRRVLKKTGTLWVNLGDSYHNPSKWTTKPQAPQTLAGGNNRDFHTGRRKNQGLPEKCLAMVPARFAIAMTSRGWILRNQIIWHKPNHMPSSVKDRFTCSYENVFFFVKSPRYFFDLDAVRVPHRTLMNQPAHPKQTNPRQSSSPGGHRKPPAHGEPHAYHRLGKNPADFWRIPTETRTLGAILGKSGLVKVPGGSGWTGHAAGGGARALRERDPRWLSPGGKNPGDTWDVATKSVPGAHFAVFPERLCEQPIKAGCPAAVCKRCGVPKNIAAKRTTVRNGAFVTCKCRKGTVPGLVLDPFVGSGTTAVVAKRLKRRFIGFDANADYIRMARQRLSTT